MSSNHREIKEIVADLWGNVECPNESISHTLFRELFSAVWEKLPQENENGAALATASCIPLWEMLNCVSSIYPCSALSPRVLLVQLLTALYPKSKDRRTAYQQLTKYAQGPTASVPLSTETPCRTEWPEHLVPFLTNIHLNDIDLDGRRTESIAKIVGAVKTLVEKVLPASTIIATSESQSFAVRYSGDVEYPLESLMMIVWKCLLFAELTGISEKRQLSQYLTSSGWASKNVEGCNPKQSYASLFSPLLTMCMVCLSCNPLTPSVSGDNVPLFDSSLVPFVLHEEGGTTDVRKESDSGHVGKSRRVEVAFPTKNMSETIRTSVVETVLDDIPGEVDFMGASSSCRDCDRVTMLCRDLLFSELSSKKVTAKSRKTVLHEVLFNRKRSRHGGLSSEGPSFTPVTSSISDILSDDKATTANTLERLACSWR